MEPLPLMPLSPTLVGVPTPSAPLSLNDPATFVAHAQANGFTPAQAAALHHQRQLFGGWRWINPASWPTEGHAMLAFVNQVNAHLDDVRTPDQWARYVDAGPFHRVRRAADERFLRMTVTGSDAPFDPQSSLHPVATECFLRLAGLDDTFENNDQIRFNTLCRLITKRRWQDQAPWPFMREPEPWTWELVTKVVQKRLFFEHMPDPPPGWTMAKATHWLSWLCERLELAGLSLPWGSSTPHDLWYAGVMLRNRELSLRSITQWQGPLLGLSGRLDLHLGSCTLFGGIAPTNTVAFPTSVLLGEYGDTLFEHEWAHALDGVFWEEQIHQSDVRLPPSTYRGLWSALSASFANRIKDLYEERLEPHQIEEDWCTYRAQIPASFQATLAYLNATPDHRVQMLAFLKQALAQGWTRDQVVNGLTPWVPKEFTRFEFWVPWLEINARPPQPGQAFPRQVYDLFVSPDLDAWRDRRRSLQDWWTNAIEHWARGFEICVDPIQPDYLGDPLRLPTWRPRVKQMMREVLAEMEPLWHTRQARWRACQANWKANQEVGEKQRWAAMPKG
jgi:hypothetical protein